MPFSVWFSLASFISPIWRPFSKKLGLKTILLISFRLTWEIPIQWTWPTTTDRAALATGGRKVRIFYIYPGRNNVEVTIASRRICDESVGAKFTGCRQCFRWFLVCGAPAEIFLYGFFGGTPSQIVGFRGASFVAFRLGTILLVCIFQWNLSITTT